MCAFVMQTANGMSAVTDDFGLMYALFPVSMVQYLIWSWAMHDTDIDPSIPEKNYTFRLSDMYAYTRKEMKSFFRYYVYSMTFAFIPVLLTRTSLLSSDLGAIGESG